MPKEENDMANNTKTQLKKRIVYFTFSRYHKMRRCFTLFILKPANCT